MVRALTFTAALAAALSIPAPASAQDDPRRDEAEKVYVEGLKLHDRHREAEALDAFQRSFAIYASPNTLVSIAREEQLLHRDLEALRHYREALARPLLNPKNAALAKRYIAELAPKFGRVMVEGPPGTNVTVAGVPERLPMDAPVDVTPGALSVEGVLEGSAYAGAANVSAGATVTIQLQPKAPSAGEAALASPAGEGATSAGSAAPGTEPADRAASPPAAPERGSFWGWRSVTGLSLVAVGLIGVGTGLVFDGDRRSKQDLAGELGADLPPGGCAGVASAQCARWAQAVADRDAASTRATVAFVGGGVALGAGAVFLASAAIFPHRRAASATRLVPIAGLDRAGLALVSAF
jgi:hypothetical protein